MNNHIEELMKAAEVEKQYYSFNSTDGNTYNWELNENGNKKYKKIFIGEPELKERTFTPAKQLELIKLLFKAIPTKSNPYFEPVKNSDKWQYVHTDLTFEEALAEMVWNALPVLDKSEVKRILKDDN